MKQERERERERGRETDKSKICYFAFKMAGSNVDTFWPKERETECNSDCV